MLTRDRNRRRGVGSLAAWLVLTAAVAASAVHATAPTGRLSGKVVDEEGRPVGELSLKFVPADGSGNAPRTLKVSKKGTFSHAFFPMGEYRVVLEDSERFLKEMTYVKKDASDVEQARSTGAAHPETGFPPFRVGLGDRIELELVIASARVREEMVQAVAIADASGPLKKMKETYDAGDMKGVVAQGEKILAEHPELGVAHYLKGMAESRLGRTDVALQSLEKALELSPDQQGVAGALGTLLLQKGHELNASGKTAEAQQTYASAAQHLDAELEKFGESPVYLANRTAALEGSGDDAAFEGALRKLVESDPGNLGAWLKLADLQSRTGRIDAAVETLRGAPAAAGPTDVARAGYNVAAEAFNAGQAEQAIAAAEVGIAADPQFPDLYRVLGRAHLSNNDRDAAVAALEKFLSLAPDAPGAETERALVEHLRKAGS